MIPARVQNPQAQVEIVVDIQMVQDQFGRVFEQVVKRPAAPPVIPPVMTLLTCIFLHGGWMHFLGNMWFLHIFGDNVEDRFGHLGYALFYLGCGVAASLVHFLSEPSSGVPTIGASGAIAGVMGAYFVWYWGAKVQAMVPIGPFLQMVVLPAPLFLGVWFGLQALQGAVSSVQGEAGGVAWWAHIGGFVVGAGAALLAASLGIVSPLNTSRRPAPGRYPIYPVRRRSDD
jgi:membrane associated rhomboid family serine protease